MTKLCARGKSAAKRKFKVYPSAYANAYASKICAGKIKDPSGTKKKDWGPKKAKVGMAVNAGSQSAIGRLEKSGMKKMMSGGFGIFSKKKKEEEKKSRLKDNADKKKKRLEELRKEMGMSKGGGADFQTSKTRIKPYGKTYKVKIEKIKPSAFAKVKKFYGPDGEVLASGPLGPVEKKRGGGIAIKGTSFKGVF